MTPPIEQVYFTWLCDRINLSQVKRGEDTFDQLLEILHNKEFVWTVPNDDNRLEDAMDLRRRFIEDYGVFRVPRSDGTIAEPKLLLGVPPLSVLEVIVSLSERLAFLDGGGPRDWAWQLIENLDLHKMRDPLSILDEQNIDEILERLIWRLYEPDGTGGFFPLAFPEENQTKVEIWYQMSAYIAEQLEH